MSRSAPAPGTMVGLGKQIPGAGGLGPIERPVPVAIAGHVVLEVTAAGLCGTDLHIEDGEFPSAPPVIMGHEVAGRVVEVGAGVPEEFLGDLVAVETYFRFCGGCEYCRAGRTNLCRERRSIGSHVDGGFAPRLLVPAANLHRLPAHIGPHAAALSEPLACVCHCLADPARISPGDAVLVTGPGTMGLLAAQVARACGGVVTVLGRPQDDVRLAAARALGFEVRTTAQDVADLEQRFDVVVDCSGSEGGIATCIAAARAGAAFVQIGLAGHPVRVPFDEICYRELTVTSGFASTPTSWRRALRLLEQRAVDLDALVSHVAPLSDWREIFGRTRRGEGIKYVFEPRWEVGP
jgi:L-iditol 2-dehydrogenase